MITTLSTTKLKKNKKNISYDINWQIQLRQIQPGRLEQLFGFPAGHGAVASLAVQRGTIVRVAGGRITPILTRTICQRMTPITSPIPIISPIISPIIPRSLCVQELFGRTQEYPLQVNMLVFGFHAILLYQVWVVMGLYGCFHAFLCYLLKFL